MGDQLRVLVTGGSGYLGQFIICGLCSSYNVGYTYLRQPVPHPPGVSAFLANIATGQGLTDAVLSFKPAVVINCAALSQPAACERDYEACKAVNVPVKLVEALRQLEQQNSITSLLIQLSTDQVYDGSSAWWTEAGPTKPVNAYGRSKLEAEGMLQQLWAGRYVALRSSLIVGPAPPMAPVDRSLFVQFVQQVLSKGEELDLFVDEYRCAIYVEDIVGIVQHLINRYDAPGGAAAAAAAAEEEEDVTQSQQAETQAAADRQGCLLCKLSCSCYNMGGPNRVNRLDMGMAIAQHCGYNTAFVKPSFSADVPRGYQSPLDISMKMDLLLHEIPSLRLTPFADAVAKIFPRIQ